MKISPRLETLASMIPLHKDVIDVGCDHGLLDIYLSLNRKDIHITATDISAVSIASAKKTAEKYNVQDQIVFQVEDGLEKIMLTSQWIVLSGMGAYTILSILDKVNLKDTHLIIGAHTHVGLVRRKLHQKGYFLIDEKAVYDGKWYVMMAFEKGHKTYTEVDYLIGPYAKNNKKYVKYLFEKEKKISQKKGEETSLFQTLQKIL